MTQVYVEGGNGREKEIKNNGGGGGERRQGKE
jgi:hypothetical protein